jgi:type IV pilus secretin PilQ/predicted competence protein
MKMTWRRNGAAWVLALSLAFVVPSAAAGVLPALTGAAEAEAQLVRVDAVVEPHAVRLHARISGAGGFEYTTYQPGENLFVVDLAGVTSSAPGGARVLKSDLVSSYRVLQFRAGERSIVRLEVLLRAAARPRVERDAAGGFVVVFEAQGQTAAAPRPEPAPAPAAAAPTAAGKPSPAATSLDQVHVRREGGATQVWMEGNGRLNGQVSRLANPERVVVDFAGVRLRTAQRNVPSEFEPVRGVRIGQFSRDVARVVIDLAGQVPYEASAAEKGFLVSLRSAAAAAAAPVSAPAAPPLEMVKKESHAAEPEAAPTTEPAPQDFSLAGMGLERMTLPESLTQASASLARPAPAESVAGEDAATKLADVKAAAPDTPAALPVSAARPAAGSSAPIPQQQKYSGEPIWVNLKDVDLKDFFRLIHEISGLNVVVDPNVRGTLTIVLDEVPWDQALDIVLKNNNLDKQIEGNVLRIATRDTLKREAETQRDLIKAQSEAVDPVVTYKTLSYAKARDMVATLKRFLSARGEVLADERSNTLIIRDIPSTLPAVESVIRQLDRKSQQVEIEARVVSASRNFARDIGTQFGISTGTADRRNIFGGLLGRAGFESPAERNPGSLPVPPLVTSGGTSIPLNTNLGAVSVNSGFSFFHSSPNLALDFILSAAEDRGVAKLLSKPKVVTQNNQQAIILQGTKIPIQTVINNTITVQYIDAALKMTVTPQITADNTVFIDMRVENSSADFARQVQGIPSLNTQETNTTVLVSDGGTVVIGGVFVSQDRTTINQVPLIGSIPLLGHLFKRTAVSTETQELLFFVTPRIVPD